MPNHQPDIYLLCLEYTVVNQKLTTTYFEESELSSSAWHTKFHASASTYVDTYIHVYIYIYMYCWI